MLYINNIEKLKSLDFRNNNFYVLTDFDRTLTTSNSLGSWSILENEKIFCKDFVVEAHKLVDIYYPYELDYTLDFNTKLKYMEEWYYSNMNLFYKYGLTSSILLECVKNSTTKLRNGAKDFLLKCNENNIPVIILSAGIGNVIVELLKFNNCYFDNIHIISNFIDFENDKMLPFTKDMIHTLNKNLGNIPNDLNNIISMKKNILLLGDLIEDINMVSKDNLNRTLTIGFLENKINDNLNYYNKNFDVVFTENASFKDVQSLIFKRSYL